MGQHTEAIAQILRNPIRILTFTQIVLMQLGAIRTIEIEPIEGSIVMQPLG